MSDPHPSQQLSLVLRAGAGDTSAQEHLIALLGRRVRTIAVAILGHPQDAEDTIQLIFLELLQSASKFRGESLHGWADRIAVRTAMRQARQRRMRTARLDAETELDQLDAPARPARVDHGIPRPLLEYLAELPEARRTALVLRHVLEYSVREIAELTATSENTVKDRLLHARQQLRQRIRRELVTGRPHADGSASGHATMSRSQPRRPQ